MNLTYCNTTVEDMDSEPPKMIPRRYPRRPS